MSTGKTLSNGTLSLRFMQNAQRAKQQAAIDLERAKVKDEAEWEVSKEIRAAWGLASTSTATAKQTIVQETSYLPFLFPSLQYGGPSSNDEAADEVATSLKISGRRTFAKGREIVATTSFADTPADADENIDIKQEPGSNAAEPSEASIPSSERPKSRRTGGVGPLTGKRTTARLAELERAGVPHKGATRESDITVLSMISGGSSAAVGVDIRRMRKLKGKEKEKQEDKVSAWMDDEVKPPVSSIPEPEKTVTNGIGKGPLSFLRPAGIDSPAPSSTSGKKSKKRGLEHDGEAGDSTESSGRKMNSEVPSVASASNTQRQVTKKKKKYMKEESGPSATDL